MDNNTSEKLVRQVWNETRAIAAQNLTTDPENAVISKPLNIHVGGVPANRLDVNVSVAIDFSRDTTQAPNFSPAQIWLSNIHVPANDVGVDAGWLSLVEWLPGRYYVFCPFIGVNVTDTYSFDVHCSALVPGTLTATIRITNE